MANWGFSQTQQVDGNDRSDKELMSQTPIIAVNANESQKIVTAPSLNKALEESTLNPENMGFTKTTINKQEVYMKIVENLTLMFYAK